MAPSPSASSTFCLEGQFQRFIPDKSSPHKTLELTSDGRTYRIKLCKPLRQTWGGQLQTGDSIRVVGKQKLKSDGRLKLKAFELLQLPTAAQRSLPAAASPKSPAKAKAKVLICQKSSCRKRGAQAVCSQMAASLAAAGLDGAVEIKGTGCMDRCKAGPHVVVMPDKTRHSRVRPEEVSTLVQQHFAAAVESGA